MACVEVVEAWIGELKPHALNPEERIKDIDGARLRTSSRGRETRPPDSRTSPSPSQWILGSIAARSYSRAANRLHEARGLRLALDGGSSRG